MIAKKIEIELPVGREKTDMAKTIFEQHYPIRAKRERHKKRRCNKTKQNVPAQTVLGQPQWGPTIHSRLS